MKTSGKTALLFTLYLSQGLPFGFQATALPVLLRDKGISLTAIGFAGALACPGFQTPLGAVDRPLLVGKNRTAPFVDYSPADHDGFDDVFVRLHCRIRFNSSAAVVYFSHESLRRHTGYCR